MSVVFGNLEEFEKTSLRMKESLNIKYHTQSKKMSEKMLLRINLEDDCSWPDS